MNRAVLFDLDGVLVDACDWHYKALNLALMHVANYQITKEDHLSTYNGLPTKTKLGMLADKGIIDRADIDWISDLKQDFTIETINKFCVESIPKQLMLAKLYSKGFKLGCVTNSISKTANLMLEKAGILKYFDCVISNEDCKNNKPHPEPYILALVRLNCIPENSFIVEDSPKGLESARLTGCKVLQVKDATEVTYKLFENKI